MADQTLKQIIDAQLGLQAQLDPLDLFYFMRTPYSGTDKEGGIKWEDLAPERQGTKSEIWNAVSDGGLTADYVSASSPGTDQSAALDSWITGARAAGRHKLYIPEGHYRIDPVTCVVNSSGDHHDVEIYGAGIGKTILEVPAWTAFDDDYTLFRFSVVNSEKSFRPRVHDIEFRMGWHCGQEFTDGTAKGFRFYPWVWATGTKVEDGQALVSSDGNYIIRYNGDGYTDASTEPTWSGAPSTDNGISVTIYAVNARPDAGTMTAGNVYQYSDSGGSPVEQYVWCTVTGTNLATASEPDVPSCSAITGGSDDVDAISFGIGTNFGEVYDCKFKGFMGYSDAGGSGVKVNSGTYNTEQYSGYRVGRCYHRVQRCVFEQFQYGTGIQANCNALWVDDCTWIRTGGWGTKVGGFNQHCIYGQEGAVLVNNCRFIEQYGGICVKVHGNILNRDLIGTLVTNCEFRDWTQWAVMFVSSGVSSITAHPDFDTDNADIAFPEKAMSVVGCHFRQTKSATDGHTSAFADQFGASGLVVTGNTFMDCRVFIGNSYSSGPRWMDDGTYSGILFANNYVGQAWRGGDVWNSGSGMILGNIFDLRGEARGTTALIELKEYAKFKDNEVWVLGHGNADGTAIINITGDNVTIEGNRILCMTNADVMIGCTANVADVVVRNNDFHFNGAARWIRINQGTTANWLLEGNRGFGTPAEAYLRGIGGDGWVFRNNSGDLFGTGRAETIRSGTAIAPITSERRGDTGDSTIHRLVDRDGARVSASGDIFGVGLYDTDWNTGDGYFSVITQAAPGIEVWIYASEQVTVGDYAIVSATAGAVAPNGTTGSTTKPTSGLIAVVTNVGTAGAGAGYCRIEIQEVNRVSPSGTGAQPYSGTTDPGVDDDNTQGHVVGITGVNTSTGDMFICLDATTGAAIWQQI